MYHVLMNTKIVGQLSFYTLIVLNHVFVIINNTQK